MALNVKQEKFIQNIVKGMSQREAYKNAYKAKYSEKSIDEKACVLFNSEKVQERYKELMNRLQDKSIMSAKERMVWLSNVINGEVKTHADTEAYMTDKIKALDILNKMSGEYITKVEADVNNEISINIELSDD